ncbi:response regulator [Bradyrhizobium canariense]|nr:response regulator [Bradyrhizobium canariense]
MMLVEMIEELGHRVVAEAGHLDQAQSLAENEQYDLAILDINLQGSNVRPVAEAITARGRPFFFLSGYGSGGVPEQFKSRPVLHKPCAIEMLSRTIDAIWPNRQPDDAQG